MVENPRRQRYDGCAGDVHTSLYRHVSISKKDRRWVQVTGAQSDCKRPQKDMAFRHFRAPVPGNEVRAPACGSVAVKKDRRCCMPTCESAWRRLCGVRTAETEGSPAQCKETDGMERRLVGWPGALRTEATYCAVQYGTVIATKTHRDQVAERICLCPCPLIWSLISSLR